MLPVHNPRAESDPLINPPVIDYMLHCQGCHLANGMGLPGAVPPLAGSDSRFLHSEAGRQFLIHVPGVALSRLSDERLARLMNWVVSHFDNENLPNGFLPYTAEEIGTERAALAVDVSTERAAALAASGVMPPYEY